MQIVINIPDKDYKRINTTPNSFNSLILLSRLYRAIKNGTPLPKGHGRFLIVSEDILKNQKINFSWSVQDWYSEVAISNATVKIIKADKEVENA